MIAVTARQDWFAPPQQFQIRPGSTLAEILDAVGIPFDLQPHYDIAINGDVVPLENRRLVRPKPGTTDRPVVITVHPPILQGGKKSTTKNALTIVATIALIAATVWVGAGGLGTALGIEALKAGTTGAGLLASSFGAPGRLKLDLP